MEHRLNFRVKVDLSKHYNDARRFSWIFIDCSTFRFISHIKQHIANIFAVREPFHLLLNGNEYLPPNEDVRVLKENEIIVVVPGSGVHEPNDFASSLHSQSESNSCLELTEQNPETRSDNGNQQDEIPTDVSVADISNAEEPCRSVSEKAENGSISDSKEINCNESVRSLDFSETAGRKRKRTRRKKSKKETGTKITENIDYKQQTNKYHANTSKLYVNPTVEQKPKIVSSCVIPTGKHIRFDNLETKKVEDGADDSYMENQKTDEANHSVSKETAVANLSTLLSLRQCSSPLTFANRKVKSANDVAIATNDEKCNGSNGVTKKTEDRIDYSELDPEKYPILQNTTKNDDIIAFKVLRIGEDYSPQISNYIIAKTRIWSPETSMYTFEILKGQDQIQTPMGKFALPDEDSEKREIDTANFNFSQLINPRLIFRQ